MRRGLKVTFVLCPEVYKYIVVRHELLIIFSFFGGCVCVCGDDVILLTGGLEVYNFCAWY